MTVGTQRVAESNPRGRHQHNAFELLGDMLADRWAIDGGEPEQVGRHAKPRPEVCVVCQSPRVTYHNYQEQPFCGPCANGEGHNSPAWRAS